MGMEEKEFWTLGRGNFRRTAFCKYTKGTNKNSVRVGTTQVQIMYHSNYAVLLVPVSSDGAISGRSGGADPAPPAEAQFSRSDCR